MEQNQKGSLYKKIFEYIQYKPKTEETTFVLPETEEEQWIAYNKTKAKASVLDCLSDVTNGIKSLSEVIELAKEKCASGKWTKEDIEILKIRLEMLEMRADELEPIILAYEHGNMDRGRISVSSSLIENKTTIERLYHLPKNKDIQTREFELKGKIPVKMMLNYIDGMVDKQLLTLALLQPLMLFEYEKEGLIGETLTDKLVNNFIPHLQPLKITTYQDVTKSINAGDCVLFIEGSKEALGIDVKGYKSRGIGKAEIEKTTRGSQAAFGEALRPNTALIHAMLQSTNLVTELFLLGKVNAKNCAVMYVDGIVNETAKKELIRRIKGVKRDDVFDAGSFSQMISDNKLQFPENLSTERPDRVVAALMQGRIAFMVDGDPFAYIAPVNLWDFFHNPEDYEMRLPAAMFMRILRYTGLLLAFFLPSIYIALVLFHYEAIPTEILLAISGYRQFVPFTSVLELLMMIFSFELIREATLRVPGQLGGSIGIVGAIILGQAAISAKLVSPLLVVVVAITGLASYVIPEYRFGFAVRITQYAMLFSAAMMGLVGVSIVFLLILLEMVGLKSLGVPFLAPIIPKTSTVTDILRVPNSYENDLWRPDELNTERVQRKSTASESWREEKPTQKEEE